MALNDLKKGITDEAREKAARAEADARAEAKRILDEARAQAKQSIAEVKESLKAAEKSTIEQSQGDAQSEAIEIVQKAADSTVEAELNRIKKQIVKELATRHMDELLKNALKRFKDVAPGEGFTVEITKKYAPLVKGAAKVVPVKDDGHIVLYTSDRKVVLDSSADTVVESNIPGIKSMLIKSMEL